MGPASVVLWKVQSGDDSVHRQTEWWNQISWNQYTLLQLRWAGNIFIYFCSILDAYDKSIIFIIFYSLGPSDCREMLCLVWRGSHSVGIWLGMLGLITTETSGADKASRPLHLSGHQGAPQGSTMNPQLAVWRTCSTGLVLYLAPRNGGLWLGKSPDCFEPFTFQRSDRGQRSNWPADMSLLVSYQLSQRTAGVHTPASARQHVALMISKVSELKRSTPIHVLFIRL